MNRYFITAIGTLPIVTLSALPKPASAETVPPRSLSVAPVVIIADRDDNDWRNDRRDYDWRNNRRDNIPHPLPIFTGLWLTQLVAAVVHPTSLMLSNRKLGTFLTVLEDSNTLRKAFVKLLLDTIASLKGPSLSAIEFRANH